MRGLTGVCGVFAVTWLGLLGRSEWCGSACCRGALLLGFWCLALGLVGWLLLGDLGMGLVVLLVSTVGGTYCAALAIWCCW